MADNTEANVPLNHLIQEKVTPWYKTTIARCVIGTIVVAIFILIILLATGVIETFEGAPGAFRTWSILDPFNAFTDSKPKKKVRINTLNGLKGVNVVTKDDVVTITTPRNNKSVSLPSKLGTTGLSQETEDLYTRINAMTIELLKMADSLKSDVIINTAEDVESFHERIQLLITYETKLDAMIVSQLTGAKLFDAQAKLQAAKTARHTILEVSEGFSNDLPNANVKFTDDMNYADWMAESALEPEIKQQHNAYVNDKTKLSNTPSFLPTMSHSTSINPVVGLRKVQYSVNGKDLVDESSRQVPSTVDFNQLDKPITITWK